ncbi:MAG TPA: MarR family winged helix-turn-helix transcriptional regulator [Solirubrobacteraceae bacterium]|nr:MarR family winged helix-turn-helix transcriptional regulator [Solirubrobacteraceae bacterium]
MSAERGWELPVLLAGAFRAIVEDLHEQLADAGHPGARPIHGFALQAVGRDGVTVSELGRRLGVTKQAASKTVASLESLGYVHRVAHPEDQRAALVMRAARGDEMLALSAEIFGRIHAEIAERLGKAQLQALEAALDEIAGERGPKLGDLPGWLR